jgi:hypothetical protein
LVAAVLPDEENSRAYLSVLRVAPLRGLPCDLGNRTKLGEDKQVVQGEQPEKTDAHTPANL